MATNFDFPEPEMRQTTEEQPMFGNPVLAPRRKRRGRALLIGIPLAVVAIALAGAAFFVTSGNRDMAADTSATETADTTGAAAPPVAPAVNPPSAAPAALAAATPPPVANPAAVPPEAASPPARPTRHAAVTRRAHTPRASSASDSSADVSADVASPKPPVVNPPPSTTP